MGVEKTALILSGGGARAAYQAGVLLALRDILPAAVRNPFPIICGTSAGAINAATLACHADNFAGAVEKLNEVWGNIHADQVYRADPAGISLTGARWLSSLMLGWIARQSPRSLLDNAPLRRMLSHKLDFSRLNGVISSGALYALSLTASGYASGHSISFFQAHPGAQTWARTHRFGCRTQIGIDHLMASCAIPFLFPAVRVNREYFGDGSMRQLAPISPAIHLGAEKILVIGAGRAIEKEERQHSYTYPSLAQIAGHALSSIFLDGLYADIENMQRINRTLAAIPGEVGAQVQAGVTLRPVDVLVISPSQRLDHLAARHAQELPWPVRLLLRGVGAMNRRGGALTSYLLFEQGYTRALIDLGYKDTMARREELAAFLQV